ncbi:hypothetical protein SLEP1_g31265 [Rubroshorea leprosula]|uniref:Uncharacterized protein n=1 Tax=Rubroshorea leprosula TaxID=152421 RepID=A0AAV5K892_9ROSI|nr:hypothetical protein SLEP1_g31265 [Rubroshorea leprosula]
MDSFQDLREFQGSQGREEEEGLISMEPITMIVPLELQNLPKTITPESSVGSSAGGDSDDHRSSSSKDSSLERTPSDVGDAGEGTISPSVTSIEANVVMLEEWENKVISRRLDNLCKAPKTLHVGFRFRVALHHDMADGSVTVKGFKEQAARLRRGRRISRSKGSVTLEQLTLFGFVDVANLYAEAYWRGNVSKLRAHETVGQGLAHKGKLILTNGRLWHRGAIRNIKVQAWHRGPMLSKELKLRLQA